MKIDPSRTSKENVLVIMDAFSKFSVAVVTPNQKALTVAKVLVVKGSMYMGFRHGFTAIKGSHLIMTLSRHCVRCTGSVNPLHVHTIHGAMPSVNALTVPCLVCYEPYQRNKRPIGQFIFQHSSLLIMQHPILQQGSNLTN